MSHDPETAQYTPEQLRNRLLEIWDDHSWPGVYRSAAKTATYPDATDLGFAITPPDLSDDAIRAALYDSILKRRDRPAQPDNYTGR